MTDYQTFKTSLETAIGEILKEIKKNSVINNLTLLKLTDVEQYIISGKSENIINMIDNIVIKLDNKTTLFNERVIYKNIINSLQIKGYENIKANNPINVTAFNTKNQLTKIEEVLENKIETEQVINFIASAVVARRFAFIYAYLTISYNLIKLNTTISSTPGASDTKNVTINQNIKEEECKKLLFDAGNQIKNLREIIKNLLLFHNEDVNLGMHDQLLHGTSLEYP